MLASRTVIGVLAGLAVLSVCAVQLELVETPIALTARWTNDYQVSATAQQMLQGHGINRNCCPRLRLCVS